MNKLVAYKSQMSGIVGDFFKFMGDTNQPENYPQGIKDKLDDGYIVINKDQIDEKSNGHVLNQLYNDFLTEEQEQNWED